MRHARLLGVVLAACGDDIPARGPWAEPTLVIALDGDDPTITGDQLYFEHASQDIHVVTGDWSAPSVPVPALDTPAWDATPEVSADGLAMLLASDRGGDLDLYESTRPSRTAQWSTPTRIDELASADLDFSATMSADRRAIVFVRPDNGRDLYASSRASASVAWSEPARLVELATPGDDSEPHLSADGLDLVYASNGDLVEARRPARAEPFEIVATFATPEDDTNPWMSADRRTLYFMRDGSLWKTTR